MLTDRDMGILDVLVKSADARHLAEIRYRKPAESWADARLVEPYSLLEANERFSVRCWQDRPPSATSSAWRCFRVDRIIRASDSGQPFKPRRALSLCDGEVQKFRKPVGLAKPPSPDDELRRYINYVEECLLDEQITLDQLKCAVEDFPRVTEERKRVAHAKIFVAATIEVMVDGTITECESDYLHRIGEKLRELGWAP